ncbi:chitosanase [Streptomyces sp. NPDC054770]
MEDSCEECSADWSGQGPNGGPKLNHYDLWLGGKGGNAFDAIDCEDALTRYNADNTPTLEPVVVNPPSGEPYDQTPIFNTGTGACYGGAQAHSTVGQYKNVSVSKCLENPGNSSGSGTKLGVATCSGAAAQTFTFRGAFLISNNLCATLSGSSIKLAACDGGPQQQWSVNPDLTISDIQTGKKCFRASSSALTAGSCSGAAAQWNFTGTGGGTTPTDPPTTPPTTPPDSGVGLADPHKKEIAMELVSSAENSSLDWKAQYKYIEDIGDGRGYTAGIIGFCSGTGDMLELVQHYNDLEPGNVLAKYLPALQSVNGTDSHTGLGTAFVNDWKTAAKDTVFQTAQNDERDRVYFNPSVDQAKSDGLGTLGQFIYYDAIVMHGPGDDPVSFGGIRATAMKRARTPAQGGNETTYLNAFLDARKAAMLTEAAHDDTSRVDTEQRVFLQAGNLDLDPPLQWETYGDSYEIDN